MNTQIFSPIIAIVLVFCSMISYAQECEDPINDSQFTTECGTLFDLCVDRAVTEEGEPVYIRVTANDEDIFDPCDIYLPLEEDLLPEHGTVVRLGPEFDCVMKYTPDPGFVGEDSFWYNFITRETCDGGPNLCFDEDGNATNVGKIWTMEFVYLGPDGRDLSVSTRKDGTLIKSISNLVSGQIYSLDGVHVGTNQSDWIFTFTGGSSNPAPISVHTSCSADILGVNFAGYFMPTSVCAAAPSAKCSCNNTCTTAATGRSMMETSSSIVQDITQVFILIQSLLPIDFSYIAGRTIARHNVVEWGIAATLNEEKLALQRSNDGIHFQDLMLYEEIKIGDFQYVDKAVDSEKSYYRLKSTSFDGEVSFSEVLTITNRDIEVEDVVVFPIPAANVLTIAADSEISRVEIVDLQGRALASVVADAGKRTVELNEISALNSGLYLSRILLANGSTVTKRIQLSK